MLSLSFRLHNDKSQEVKKQDIFITIHKLNIAVMHLADETLTRRVKWGEK